MDGEVVIKTKLNTKSFEVEIQQTEQYLKKLIKSYEKAMNPEKGFGKNEENIRKLRLEIEKTTNKLADLKKNQASLGDNSNSGLGGIVGKVSKWGLAIMGIRSAYMFIRRSAGELAQQNDEIAGKLNAITGSLTNLLAPIIEVIVNLVYKLLAYLNVITKSFGIDLFAKSSKSAKSTLGTAQKLRKTLAGFDEMNILSDTSTSGGGGGSADIPEPPVPDTSKFEEFVENYKTMWAEMVETTRAEALQIFTTSDSTWGLMKFSFWEFIHGIILQIQGIVDVFGGVFKTIKGIALGDTDLIKEGITQILKGLGEFFMGFLETFILAPLDFIVGVIWGFAKSIFDFVAGIIKKIGDNFSNLWNSIKTGVTGIASKVKTAFTNVINFFKTAISNIVTLFKNIGTSVGDAIGGAFKSVINGVLTAVEKILNSPINAINKLINKINDVPGISISKLSTFKFPRLAQGGIVNMPGRGVPIGGALTGERGAEGVIPLTDSQQMSLLGEAIGRYITINANITNTMNGRIISRELQKINNENNFASNR